MPLEFDPVYHTEAMVRILREQGSTQYAMELAEVILQNNPEHEAVKQILAELREEARKAFERFKNSGRPSEATFELVSEIVAEESIEEPSAASVVEFSSPVEVKPTSPVHLTLVEPPPDVAFRQAKIRRLEALLRRFQSIRNSSHAS